MKRNDGLVKLTALIILILLFIFIVDFIYRYKVFRDISNKIPYVPSYSVSVIVYGSSEDSISAKVSFINDLSESIGVVERSFSASNLYLDFLVINLKNQKITLPYRLFTNKTLTSQSGVILYKNYINRGNCLLFSIERFKKDIYKVFRFAVKGISGIFSRYIEYKTLELTNLESNREYIFNIDNQGNITISE